MSEKDSVKYSFQPKLEYILIRDPFCIKMNAKNIDEWTKPSYERCKWAVGIIFVVILPQISNKMIRKWKGPTPSTEEFASLSELIHGIYPRRTRRKKFHARVHANIRTIIVQIQYFNYTISRCVICMQWWPTKCGCTCSIYIISSLEFDVIPFSLTFLLLTDVRWRKKGYFRVKGVCDLDGHVKTILILLEYILIWWYCLYCGFRVFSQIYGGV